MRTIYIFLLTSFVFFYIPSFAQKDFLPGFIINQNNDTIRGLVNQKSNYLNAKSCEFRKDIKSKSEVYLPSDIKGYGAGSNRLYISKDVNINQEKRKVFLEFLVNGIVDLYIYKDKESETFYIQKDTTLYELDNSKKEFTKEGVRYSKNSNKYVGVLNYLFKDSPKLYQEIKNTGYTDNSLIKITRDYHNSVCSEYECIVYKKNTKVDIYLEPNIGYLFSKMSFPEVPQIALDNNFFGGLNLRFAPMKFSRWNILIGINYSTNNYKFDILMDKGIGFPEINYLNIKYTIIRTPIMAIYSFPFKKFQPFIEFGFVNALFLNSKYNVINFSKFNIGVLAGVGIRYQISKKNNLFIKTDLENRFPGFASNYDYENYSVQSILLNFGYSFKINK